MSNFANIKSAWFNYLPISYTFQSRIITPFERISWVIIFPLFLFIAGLLFSPQTSIWQQGFDFSLHFIAVVAVYEVGYLFNDLVTTKKELNPTLRQGSCSPEYSRHFGRHVGWRISLGGALAAHYIWHHNSYHLVVLLSAILLAFYAHNTLRNRLNIITYLGLVSLRYSGLIVATLWVSEPFAAELQSTILVSLGIWVFLAFPLCRTIEHACKKKYKLTALREMVGSFDAFRVKYYVLLVTIGAMVTYWTDNEMYYLIIPSYFLLFRCAAFGAKDRVRRNKHQAY